MLRERIGVRVSPELRRLILEVGELSAATQALLILGAAQVGVDLRGLQTDIGTLLGKRLTPATQAALLAVLNGWSTPVQHQPPAVTADTWLPDRQEGHDDGQREAPESPWEVGFAV